jgi:hypothetical protein
MSRKRSTKRKFEPNGAQWTGLLVGVALISKHLSPRMEMKKEMGCFAP